MFFSLQPRWWTRWVSKAEESGFGCAVVGRTPAKVALRYRWGGVVVERTRTSSSDVCSPSADPSSTSMSDDQLLSAPDAIDVGIDGSSCSEGHLKPRQCCVDLIVGLREGICAEG